MQLLIDSLQETPTSLRIGSAILAMLASLAEGVEPSEELLADMSQRFAPSQLVPEPHASGGYTPAPLPAADPELVQSVQDVAAKAFGVPTGTIAPVFQMAAPLATTDASAAPTIPSALPGVTTAPTSALLVTTTGAGIAPVAGPGVEIVVVPGAESPSATLPTQVADTVSSDRDGRNFPWDARIHSETKKMNADNTWRNRRNLDPAVKAQIEAELQAKYGAAAGQQTLPGVGAAPPPPSDVAPPPPSSTVLPFPLLPVRPTNVMGLPDAGNAPVVPAKDFRSLMSKVNVALAAGKLTQDQLTLAHKAVNLDSITALAGNPGLVPIVDANINAYLEAAAR